MFLNSGFNSDEPAAPRNLSPPAEVRVESAESSQREGTAPLSGRKGDEANDGSIFRPAVSRASSPSCIQKERAGEEFEMSGTISLQALDVTSDETPGIPRWKRVFLQRAVARRLLQHEWTERFYAAHAEALEENRRLLASQASFFSVGSQTRGNAFRVSSSPKRADAINEAGLGSSPSEGISSLAHLRKAVGILEDRCAEQQRLLQVRDAQLLRLRRLLAEREAEAAAAKGACVLLLEKQQEQQLLLQRAHQEGAEKARETEMYLRELLQYKEAEAAALAALNSGFDGRNARRKQDRPNVSLSNCPPFNPSCSDNVSRSSRVFTEQLTERGTRSEARLNNNSNSGSEESVSEDSMDCTSASLRVTSTRSEIPSLSKGLSSFRLLRRVGAHTGKVLCCKVAVAKEGVLQAPVYRQSAGLIASAGEDGTVNVFALRSEVPRLFSFDVSPYYSECVALDLWLEMSRQLLLMGCSDGSVFVIDLPSQSPRITLQHPGNGLIACGFLKNFSSSPSPSRLRCPLGVWSVGKSGTLRAWSIGEEKSDGVLLCSFRSPEEACVAAASFDRSVLVVGFADGSLRAYSLASYTEAGGSLLSKVLDARQIHRGAVLGVDASPDGSLVVSLGTDSRLVILSLLKNRTNEDAAGKVVLQLRVQDPQRLLATPRFSSDGQQVAATRGVRILYWDLASLCGEESPLVKRGSKRDSLDLKPPHARGRRNSREEEEEKGDEQKELDKNEDDDDTKRVVTTRREDARGEERPSVLDHPAPLCVFDWKSPFLVSACSDGAVFVWSERDKA